MLSPNLCSLTHSSIRVRVVRKLSLLCFVTASRASRGRSKLRWATSDVLSRKRQICVAIPLAPRSVRVKAADLDSYTGRDALRVRFQTARYDSAAPWSGRGCKSAWLQQYRQACKLRLAARAEAGWSGGAVLTIARAHPSELASPPPPAQCTAVHARAMPLVHIAA